MYMCIGVYSIQYIHIIMDASCSSGSVSITPLDASAGQGRLFAPRFVL